MRYHLKVEGEQNPFVRALIKYTCHTSDKFANYLVLANMTIFLKGGLFLTNVQTLLYDLWAMVKFDIYSENEIRVYFWHVYLAPVTKNF